MANLRRLGVNRVGVRGAQADSAFFRRFDGLLPVFLAHRFRLQHVRLANLFDRQYLLHHQPLRDDRLEFVVDEIDRIDFSLRISVDDAIQPIPSRRVFDFIQNADLFADDRGAHGFGGSRRSAARPCG